MMPSRFGRYRRQLMIALAATLGPAQGPRAQSGAWPERPITIFVPSAAGGAADFTGRTWSAFLSRALGGAVVTVDNKAGAGGIVGTLAARARPRLTVMPS